MNTLNNEILSAIDNIDSCIMEAEFAVINSLCDYYHKESLMIECEGCNIYQESVLDGFKYIGKKSISFCTKIIGLIKKFFELIVHGFQKIISYIKRIFNKGKKSASQIADEIIPKKDIKKRSTFSSDKSVKIPGLGDVQVPLNNLIVKFNDDNTFVIIPDPYNFKDAVAYYDEELPSKSGDYAKFFNLLNNEKLFEELERRILDIIAVINGEKDGKSIKMVEMDNVLLAGDENGPSKKYTLKELTDFQSRFHKLSMKVATIQDMSKSVENLGTNVIIEMNYLLNQIESIHMAINRFGKIMSTTNIIDGIYVEAISDVNVLSAFVDGCINAGIHPKYIMHNAWLISDPSLTGDGDYDPIWGQSRGVFYPSNNDDVVYKLAFNGMGVRSNRNELSITELFQQSPDDIKLIAPIIKSYHGDAIIEQQRVDASEETRRSIKNDTSDEIITKFWDVFKVKNKNLKTLPIDVDKHNIGLDTKNNRPVIFDYGYITRTI